MQKESPEWPPLWRWILHTERRLSRLEGKLLGKQTTDRGDESQRWTPRDWMMAFAGLSMLLAALSEKIGWSSVFSNLVALYGAK